MFKRGAPGSSEPEMLAEIRKIVSEENSKLVESFQKRFQAVEARQDQLEHRIEELERKLGRSPGSGGGTSASFQPRFLEIKGFCEWGKRLENGATREDATKLMELLTPTLPSPLKGHISHFNLEACATIASKSPSTAPSSAK